MTQAKTDYFGSESPLSGPSSGGASPSNSAMLSPTSSSVGASQLSLLALNSQRNSPSTSACTSVSDLSSEADKLSLAHAKERRTAEASPLNRASNSSNIDEEAEGSADDSEAAAIEAENRRVEEELDSALAFGAQIVQREARALAMAAKRLSKHQVQQDGFRQAIRLVMRATTGDRGGKVVLTGVGKSGIIAKKLSATFLSLGTPSMFLHPTEALHGDLGLLTPHRDVVIALSHSGSSPEILALVPHLNARRCPIIALVGKRDSALVRASDAWIDCATGKDDHDSDSEEEEDEEAWSEAVASDSDGNAEESSSADGLPELRRSSEPVASTSAPQNGSILAARRATMPSCDACDSRKQRSTRRKRNKAPRPTTDEAWDDVPAPSSSTTVALAMGDALAFSVTRAKGLGRDMFAFNHPGGKLGADFRLQGQSVPLQTYDPKGTGTESAVATPIAA
ncbi:Sugar isomerase (SIS) [Kalmanozyma brasiliensis GHG001]|uniref:Sugar isomerase (SIS) n=1 Tax=Kalmanozyma brasiliensis (strain GHG001) TaxID=1365824 RepID=UPI002867C2B5|nr:Sugar isomerase (SIS) [Kalmanozyma brasiliensis GHG001]EST05462.2 Sugar isomerase (SIS) [Kalmanozyma brasiliensis GHG001]